MCQEPLCNWNAAGKLVEPLQPAMAAHEAPVSPVAPWMDPKAVEEFLSTPLFPSVEAEVPRQKPCPWMKEEDVQAFLSHQFWT